jgi:uncharacterized protein
MIMTEYESLLDYRRTVAGMYARIRDTDLSLEETCLSFRRERDLLFAAHPQSALSDEQKSTFSGLNYYPYDPTFRFVLPIEPDVEPLIINLELQDDGIVRLNRFGKIHFSVDNQPLTLSLYWILGYGGGIFLPFRDLTGSTETYGGGRYLLDTIKHADLGQQGAQLVIDFNYAYNPSCAYNPRWHCPLAPAENRLSVAIPAGEKRFE